ncbi:MAG: arylsulfatase [Planctomycetales bacterium]|nr:arylsulfatase [Planctomycetales bacterium]
MRRYRTAIVVLSFISAFTTASLFAAERPPNLLLIMTDDQGYGDFSLHGNPHLSTPHIDRLGRSSVRFDRFFVNSFCAPTRAALLTGRYPLRCGVWGVTHNKEAMRLSETTLAEALSAAGYRTGCFGKWHNGEQFPYTATGQGFQEFFGFHNGHINNYFDTVLLRGATPEPTRGFITDVLIDEAIRFVRSASKPAGETTAAQPFFCYLAFNAPHSPFQVPDRYFDKFKAMRFDEKVAAFYGMCENIDDNVGRLLGVLDELRLTENTIVVFLTDNGGTAGVKTFNAGMRGGKTSVHEGGTRVPLFIRWPAKIREPKVVTQIAAHIDLFPTLLDLCGVKPPTGPKLDGVSLRPLLEGKSSNWPDRVLFTHNPTSETNHYPGAVRTQRHRLVREIKGPGGGSRANAADTTALPWQLYDMQADPGEERDLAAKQPGEVERLSRLYEQWFDDVSSAGLRRFPIPIGHAEENPVTLHAPQAFFDGGLKFFAGPGFAHDWLTGWTSLDGRIWFDVEVATAGEYEVTLNHLCPPADAGSKIVLTAGDSRLEAMVPGTEIVTTPLPHRDGGSNNYVNRAWATLPIGNVRLSQGQTKLTLHAIDKPGGQVLDFKGLTLRLR